MRRVELLRREISRKRSPAHKIAIVIGGVALAALVRVVIDQGRLGVPFVTYAPVVLLIAVLLRWRMAAFSAVLSFLSIVFFFHVVPAGSNGGSPPVMIVALALTSVALIYIGDTLHVAIVAIEQQRQRFEAFNTELQHRSMNALQIIQALVSQAAASDDHAGSYQALAGRITAMAAANKLLGPSQMQACDLREAITRSIQPFPHQRFKLFGPQCQVTGKSGVRLIMALHELGTNAIKYGALSNGEGTVAIDWQLRGEDIELHWKEVGGPPVMPPTRRGLGSTILSPSDGLSSVELEFHPQGVECRLTIQAELALAASAPARPADIENGTAQLKTG